MRPGLGGYPAPVIAQPYFDEDPVVVTCPICRKQGPTRTRHRIGTGSLAAMLVIAVLFFPLFWLPLVCHSCQSVEHRCSTCNCKVGEKPFLTNDTAYPVYGPPTAVYTYGAPPGAYPTPANAYHTPANGYPNAPPIQPVYGPAVYQSRPPGNSPEWNGT